MKNKLKFVCFYLFCVSLLFIPLKVSASTITYKEQLNQPSFKEWKIKFNGIIDNDEAKGNIRVEDSKGNIVNTFITVNNDIVTVAPLARGYKEGESYYLKIDRYITSRDLKKLKNDYSMKFTIKKEEFKLGNERLLSEYGKLIDGKNIGLITNQTGLDSNGVSTITKLANYKKTKLIALYGPEHGIDGEAKAGEYVKSYTHPTLKIPVYSLYGDTRKPTSDMLRNVDAIIFDIQDIGARSYTYISTLNYAMKTVVETKKKIIVLDRPNPLGGNIMDGPVMEDKFITFVGVDNLPMTYGMTVGELAKFFNRKINADLTVIPMTGYNRDMIYQDTGLKWVQSSPYIPDITSVFCYNATGLGEGTGIFQDDYFKWVGGKGIDSNKFASLLNGAKLPGVTFMPEKRGTSGGVRLNIVDYHKFNPAKTGIYMLFYARSLNNFTVPKSGKNIVMFDKIMGTALIGQSLEKKLMPQQIESQYKGGLEKFKVDREKYLIYN
ncbi:DUF1343 domain-containing protein [Clostridium sp.]|jgi:uncharacterized protein YbbC (DUF1343 family)|uniref:DUF1343 domain-containing protein n=1 Tax=Clostridium sp. TaxID=1506 RepID=UPI0039F64656